MKYLIGFVLLSIISACNNSHLEVENTEPLTWEKIADIPQEYARINSSVIVDNSIAYLMPGKGNSRFSSVPEIVTYSDELGWNMVGTYQGVANVGQSAFWQTNNKVMVVGGANSSNAPFDQIATMSLDGSDFTILDQVFPKGPNRTKSYAQLGDKGYMSYATQETFQSPILKGVTSFNFVTSEWVDISLPNTLSTGLVSTETTLFLFDSENSNNNFFRYIEQDDSWSQLADFSGEPRSGFSMIASDNAIYIGFGTDNSNVFKDIWRYDIEKNKWDAFLEYPGPAFHSGIGFCINDKLFFGAGSTTVIIGDNGTPLNTNMYSIKIGDSF